MLFPDFVTSDSYFPLAGSSSPHTYLYLSMSIFLAGFGEINNRSGGTHLERAEGYF